MPKIAVLFDIDGTLIRTGGVAADTLDQAMEELYGIKGGMKQVEVAGRTDPLIVRSIFDKLRPGKPGTDEEVQAAIDRYVELLPEALRAAPNFRVLPGLPALLEELARDARVVMGLATGNVERGGRIKLGHGKLNDYFPFGGFACDAEERPALVGIAAKRARERAGEDIPPERVFVVGDTPHDISAARAIGAKALAVATGPHSSEKLRGHDPDVVFENLNAIDEVMAFLGL